jgi:RimJ/RimL family protein N-acetyltransferase
MFAVLKGTSIFNTFSLPVFVSDSSSKIEFEYSCKAVGAWLLEKPDWLRQMMLAREKNREMYFSRFPPSLESLRNYLEIGPIGNPNQILFLIINRTGELCGHVGLKINPRGGLDIDNILRISEESPGIMEASLGEMISWAREKFGVLEFTGQVISTNTNALDFYSKLGCTIIERKNLRIEEFQGGISKLIPCEKNLSNIADEMFVLEIRF